MSKSTEEFKRLMEGDRGERAIYEKADQDETIRLPITRDGFEALIARACWLFDIPVTDPLRNVLVGFVHHIENDKCETTLRAVGATLFKSMSNHCTYEIDQEIKKVANAEMEEERQKLRDAAAAIEKENKIKVAEAKRKQRLEKKNGKSKVIVKHAPNETTV